jgi:hypothetical protein
MKESLDPQDYVERAQDGVWDAALAVRLRAEPEEVRAEFLSRVLVHQERVEKGKGRWFDLASLLLTSHASYKRLLRDGLAVANAQSIKQWLEFCVQRIGMRRVVHVLREEDASRPEAVNITTYWLPGLARTPKEKEAVKRFLADRQGAQKKDA